MKRAYSLIPLIFVGLLAALTYWLEKTTEAEEKAKQAAARHDPDFIVEKFTLQRFNETGKLVNSLIADKMTHYPDDNTAELINPVMNYHRQEAPTKLSANQAKVFNEGKEVQLKGNVRLNRPPGSAPALMIQSDAMTIYPETEKAHGNSPVTINQGHSTVHGSGLDYDGKSRLATLYGRVHGQFSKGK